MKFSYFILTLFLFLLVGASFVSAIESFKRGDKIQIRHPIRINDDPSSTITANITIKDPEGIVIVGSSPMIYDAVSQEHNFTLRENLTQKIGVYDYTVTATDGTLNQTVSFTFEVNALGADINKFPIQLVFLILGFIMVGVSYISDRLTLFRSIGSMMIMVIGVLTLFPGYQGLDSRNLLGQVVGFGSIGAGFYFLVEGFMSRDSQTEYYSQDVDDGRFNG